MANALITSLEDDGMARIIAESAEDARRKEEEGMKKAMEESLVDLPQALAQPPPPRFDLSSLLRGGGGGGPAQAPPRPSHPQPGVVEADVASLVAMGFSDNNARAALRVSRGDRDEAVARLLGNF